MKEKKEKENLIHVVIAAGSVIKKNEKYLLVQEKQTYCYGLWNLPAGRVEKGYTIEQTAIKEAKEETGYDVEIIRELGVWHKDDDKAVKHPFEVKIIGGDLKFPKDELLDAKWFTFKEIEQMEKNKQLRGYWVFKAIKIVEN